jgi:hypothetical protein
MNPRIAPVEPPYEPESEDALRALMGRRRAGRPLRAVPGRSPIPAASLERFRQTGSTLLLVRYARPRSTARRSIHRGPPGARGVRSGRAPVGSPPARLGEDCARDLQRHARRLPSTSAIAPSSRWPTSCTTHRGVSDGLWARLADAGRPTARRLLAALAAGFTGSSPTCARPARVAPEALGGALPAPADRRGRSSSRQRGYRERQDGGRSTSAVRQWARSLGDRAMRGGPARNPA